MIAIDLVTGKQLTALWYWTTGPRTKPVTVKRLTPKQVITVDEYGDEDRFWQTTGQEVGGALHLMTPHEAIRTVRGWRVKAGGWR